MELKRRAKKRTATDRRSGPRTAALCRREKRAPGQTGCGWWGASSSLTTNPIPTALPSHWGGGLPSPAPAGRWRLTPCERLSDPESGDTQVLAESWQPPPSLPAPSPTPPPAPGATAGVGVGGTGLVFWNSCSRRWARLECGDRLRTRTFMETCWWRRRRRRRRRRRPKGSQRPERQRPERPDPRPYPGAGRAQPLRAQRGHSLVAGSWRVRESGNVGRGRRGPGGVGSPPTPLRGRGPQGDVPRSRLLAGLRLQHPSARGCCQLWRRGRPGPSERRPAGSAGWRPGSARRPALLLSAPARARSAELRSAALSTPTGKSPPRASGVGAVPSLYPWGPSRYKVRCRPPPTTCPRRSVSARDACCFLRENQSRSVPAAAGE